MSEAWRTLFEDEDDEVFDLANSEAPALPSFLPNAVRADDAPLFYEGRAHQVAGVSESGKTMLAYQWAIQHALAGGRTFLFDYEMGKEWAWVRASVLGAAALKGKSGQLLLAERKHLAQFIDRKGEPGDLGIIDSADMAYAYMGLNPNYTEDAASFSKDVLVPARELGMTLIILDHLTTTATSKRGPAGNFRKLADCDVSYKLTMAVPLSKSTEGHGRLYVDKDRGGKLDFITSVAPASKEPQRVMADVELVPGLDSVEVFLWEPIKRMPLDDFGGFDADTLTGWADRIVKMLGDPDSKSWGVMELRARTALSGSRWSNARAWALDQRLVVTDPGSKSGLGLP